ncbi:MAG: PQQ-dependent sugar dehydrogenase [Planctomycetota bacterium]
MRKTLVSLMALGALAGGLMAPATAQNLKTTRVVAGLTGSLYVCAPNGDTDRLFVVRQSGQIRVLTNVHGTPVLETTPFLTVTGLVSGGEQGLLGMAFHPDYANNGRFFVNYTGAGGATKVVEYQVSASDPNVADPTPVQTLLTIAQPFSNHNGGCIQFGPDGYLYIGTGDGGSGGDPGDRAQSPLQLLGKMLRLDVDAPAPFIPPTNPFVGVSTGADEVWSTGLRNPWRWSFDRLTGDLWIGDVGQNAWEEINFVPASSPGGENYGWRCMEGNNCYTASSGCTCNATNLIDPVQAYSHGVGFCVTGGYVYRGNSIPSLNGTYFYADYGTNKIWSLRYDGTTVTEFTDRTLELRPAVGSITQIASFGEDGVGELYIVELGGEVWRIEQDCDSFSYCQATANSTGTNGLLFHGGSLNVSDNNFALIAANLPQSQFAYMLGGTAQGFVANPGGSDGNLCLGGSLVRFNAPSQIGMPDFLGVFSVTLDLTNFPANPTVAVQGGETWYFQCWHRENNGGSNFTTGLEVLFCP